MTAYEEQLAGLADSNRKWLITGVAGFIGSKFPRDLLRLDQEVVGLDNFATGHRRNLEEVERSVGAKRGAASADRGRYPRCCTAARPVAGIDHVLHQAALGSVPRSIDDPVTSNGVNVGGFVNMMVAARDAKVASFVYAASSSTYGDEAPLPKIELRTGRPLSPYALTKSIDELYAEMFARAYGFRATGLRYFNVFGPRQDPNGAYAAVIPKWASAMMRDEDGIIYGDGDTSRDFCYIANAIQANILAALAPDDMQGEVFDVAVDAGFRSMSCLSALRAVCGLSAPSVFATP